MSIAEHIEGHAGEQAVAAMRGFGVDVMFTLNGGHIWPLYEAARNQGVRIVDTRHEQSAAFAAEAYAKLTRRAGVAALTAGPGITNGVSAITSAWRPRPVFPLNRSDANSGTCGMLCAT